MKKVHEVSKSIGVSKRTLQYYDEIGLLSPTKYTESGYRLYDDVALEKLWKILLMRELGYQLNDIKKIMNDPDFDMRDSIEKHIEILTKKKNRLDNLIGYASIIKMTGIIPLSFEEYGDITFEEFIENSKKTWNTDMVPKKEETDSPLNHEFIEMIQQSLEKHLNHQGDSWNDDELNEIECVADKISNVVNLDILLDMQECIEEFANLTDRDVDSKEVQGHVGKLYAYINVLSRMSGISDRFMSLSGFSMYSQIFASGGDLGMMHTKRLGEETTDFIAKAIQFYCDKWIAEQKKKTGEKK